MAWDHGMVESQDYTEAPRSRDDRAMPPVEPALDQARPPRPLQAERARTHDEVCVFVCVFCEYYQHYV